MNDKDVDLVLKAIDLYEQGKIDEAIEILEEEEV